MKFQNGSLRLVLLCCVAFLSSGVEAADNSQQGKKLIRVNGADVYESDFDISIGGMIKKINTQAIPDSEKQKQINELRAKNINELIQIKRLEQEAKANNIEISPAEIIGFVVGKAGESFMSAEEYKDGFIKNEGMSEQDFETHIRRIMERESLIDLKFADKLQIDDKERDAYIQTKSRLFDKHVPESVSLEYIEVQFVSYPVTDEHKAQVGGLIDEIHEKAKGGEDFYGLSKQYPQTSVYRVKKGFTAISPASSPFPFAEVLSMGKGQVSDVIESQGKSIIFKVVNRVSSYEMTDMEIKEKASRLLLAGKRRYLLQQYKLSLLNRASVELLDESAEFKEAAQKYRPDLVQP